jgi:protein SCO1/2/putative membrane protein
VKDKLLWGVFVVIAACAVAALVGFFLKRPSKYPKAPDFKVVERNGQPLTRRDLLGEVWIADFIFARCPTACPAMNSAMFELRKRVPELKVVTFTVDPEHDTPKHLEGWVKSMGLEQPGWSWGSGVSEAESQRIAAGFLQPAGREGTRIVHSERFVLVDRYGRIRGIFPVLDPSTFIRDPEAVPRIELEARKVLAERALPLKKLPSLNAALNGTSGVFLLVGFAFIKAKRIGAHKACMLLALGCSTLFLVSYLTAHYYLGSTKYAGEGPMRTAYFAILISHTVLAAIIVPLAGITVVRAFQGAIERHKAVARWTFPLWLYVSVTGVVIYFMLYGGDPSR